MPTLQGLVFDLDGTLLDGAHDICTAVNTHLRAHGRRELPLADIQSMMGDGLLTIMQRAFAATGEPISDTQTYNYFQELSSYYRTIANPDPSQIFPNVQETLDFYRGQGVRLGVCTNKPEADTKTLLARLGLASCFAFIAGGDTFPARKPKSEPLLGVLEKMGVAATDAVMVGDSKYDVMAAKAAGIPCVVVTHGYGEDYEDLGADKTIKGFQDLAKALQELGF